MGVLKFNPNTHPGITHKPGMGTSAPKTSARNTTIRYQVLSRDRVCQHCGSGEDLTLDHIVPRSQNGCTCVKNLQALCPKCNRNKGSRADPKGAVGHRRDQCPVSSLKWRMPVPPRTC